MIDTSKDPIVSGNYREQNIIWLQARMGDFRRAPLRTIAGAETPVAPDGFMDQALGAIADAVKPTDRPEDQPVLGGAAGEPRQPVLTEAVSSSLTASATPD